MNTEVKLIVSTYEGFKNNWPPSCLENVTLTVPHPSQINDQNNNSKNFIIDRY